jgi:hypothetical protein
VSLVVLHSEVQESPNLLLLWRLQEIKKYGVVVAFSSTIFIPHYTISVNRL